jgi:hypothetical protein
MAFAWQRNSINLYFEVDVLLSGNHLHQVCIYTQCTMGSGVILHPWWRGRRCYSKCWFIYTPDAADCPSDLHWILSHLKSCRLYTSVSLLTASAPKVKFTPNVCKHLHNHTAS